MKRGTAKLVPKKEIPEIPMPVNRKKPKLAEEAPAKSSVSMDTSNRQKGIADSSIAIASTSRASSSGLTNPQITKISFVASEDSDIEDLSTEESEAANTDDEDSLDSSDEGENSDPPSDDSDFRRPLSTDDEEYLPEVTKTDKDLFGNFTGVASELNLNEPLYPGADSKIVESLSKLSLLGKKHNMSKKAMSGLYGMFCLILPENNTFVPEGEDNFFETMAKLHHKTDTDNVKIICTICKAAHKDKNCDECPHCNANCKSKFAMNDLEAMLVSMFEKRGFAQILESQVDCFTAKPPIHSDELVYKDLPFSSDSSTSIYDLKLIHNSKSLNLSQYEKHQTVWSHSFVICNLPPALRHKYVLAGALILAKKESFHELSKFYLTKTVKPLLEYGLKWRHPVSKLEITSKISIIATTSADPQVERNFYQLDSTQACKICDIKCSTFKLVADQGERMKKGQTVRGYSHKVAPSTLRTHFSKTVKGKSACSVTKLLNPPALFLSKDCEIITNSSPDYIGSSVMGVFKKWTINILKNAEIKPDDNGIKIEAKIDARMDKFKVPKFSDKPLFDLRPDCDFDDMAPQHFRDWLLYFSLPCLDKLIPKNQLRQHGLLVESIYLLLKSEVTETDRRRAEKLLFEYSKLLSRNNPIFRSINLHKHLHFAESVKHLGPLWAHSTLLFHEANEIIKDTLTSSYNSSKPNVRKPAGKLAYAIDTLNDALSMELLRQVNDMKEKPEEFILRLSMDPAAISAINNTALITKIGSLAAKEAKYFKFCKVRGLEYYSEDFNSKNNWENSYFVAYEDPLDQMTKHALVTAFVLSGIMAGSKKYFIGKSVLLKEAAFQTSLGCNVSHIRRYSVLNEYVCEEVKYLRNPLFHLDKLLAEPPNMYELNQF